MGLLHAIYLFCQQGGMDGLYRSAWALILWTVFGPYVLAFWLIGLLFRVIAQVLPLRRMWAARRAA